MLLLVCSSRPATIERFLIILNTILHRVFLCILCQQIVYNAMCSHTQLCIMYIHCRLVIYIPLSNQIQQPLEFLNPKEHLYKRLLHCVVDVTTTGVYCNSPLQLSSLLPSLRSDTQSRSRQIWLQNIETNFIIRESAIRIG